MTQHPSNPPASTTAPRRAPPASPRGAMRIVRRYEFGWPTVVFILTTVFLSIGAINSQNNLLFWAFGVSVGGLVISGVISGAALMSLRLERVAPRLVRAGEPARIAYRVRNTARWMPAFGLVIRERPDATARGRGLMLETGIGYLPAGRAVTAVCPFVPSDRGVLRLHRVELTSTAPFGLLRKTLSFFPEDEVAIAPLRIPVRRESATPSGHAAGPKRPDRRRVGHGEEFFALREYRAGDSPRTIAWRPSARHDQLVVRQMTPPAPPRVVIRLAPMDAGVPAPLVERTLALAAAAIEAACDEGMAVAFEASWLGVSLPFRGGEPAVEAALTSLARVELNDAAHASGSGRFVAENGQRHAAVWIAATRSAMTAHAEGVVLIADEPLDWLKPGTVLAPLSAATPPERSRAGVLRRARTAATRWIAARRGATAATDGVTA